MKSAKKEMIKAMKKDFEGRFRDFDLQGKMRLFVAYTKNEEEVFSFIEEIKKEISGIDYEIEYIPLSLSVSCHIGPGALAIASSRVVG